MNRAFKIYMAPFQGITGTVFRDVYTSHFKGVDKLYTPFFTGIYKKKNLTTRSDKLNVTEHNKVLLVPQILSKDADEIFRFADFCGENGFNEINWNLGCPYPRVANKKRGSGMLPYPEMVSGILEHIHMKLPIDLSVKCRLGYYSADEIFELIPIFNSYHISELIIHARIGKQMYKGEVDTDTFERCMDLCEVPLIYNGDIFSVEDMEKFKTQFPSVNSWMIGRGLLMDPFLPGDIKGVAVEDRNILVQKFINELYLAYRKKMNNRLQAINVLKELWGFLRYSFKQPNKVFNRVKKCKSFDEYEQAVSDVFNNHEWLGSAGKQFILES